MSRKRGKAGSPESRKYLASSVVCSGRAPCGPRSPRKRLVSRKPKYFDWDAHANTLARQDVAVLKKTVPAQWARRMWDLRLSIPADSGQPLGGSTSFPRSVMAKEDETVVFSYITYRDRAHRDEVTAAAMKHQGFIALMNNPPFDGKRMIWGGFAPFVTA